MSADPDKTLHSADEDASRDPRDAVIADLTACLADARRAIEELKAEFAAQMADARQTIEHLKHEVLLLRHWRYGRHSEKTPASPEDPPVDAPEPAISGEAAPAVARKGEAPIPSGPAKGKAKPHGRRTLPDHLPVERVVVEPSPEERVCSPCGAEKIVIGEEARRELDYKPGIIFIREYVRPVYACPKVCEGQVVVAPPPPAPIAKGLPGPGLLARVVVDKYGDHLPLARQESRFERDGLLISRQTLCDWCAQAAHLLTTFVDLLLQEVLRSKTIHTDDMPVKYLDPPGNKSKTGRLWIYHGDRRHPYSVFTFSPDRRRIWPADTLAGWTGHLQADAFSGYDSLYANGGIVEVACWAHARRKFKEAELSDKRAVPITRRIGELYAVERSIREKAERNGWSFADPGKTGDQAEALRQRRRMAESIPLLAVLRTELDALAAKAWPKSPLGQAATYALNHWKALTAYAENGALNIDNNTAERELRPVAVGRKNYLFLGSPRGGHTAATLYTVVASAKRHKLDPWEYLRDLFRCLPTMSVAELPEQLPDRWKATKNAETATRIHTANNTDATPNDD